jgi:hypothetical protein
MFMEVASVLTECALCGKRGLVEPSRTTLGELTFSYLSIFGVYSIQGKRGEQPVYRISCTLGVAIQSVQSPAGFGPLALNLIISQEREMLLHEIVPIHVDTSGMFVSDDLLAKIWDCLKQRERLSAPA